MGQLVTRPYDPADGQEYVHYLQHVLTESERLRVAGRLPDDEGVASFLDHVRTILLQVRRDLAGAPAATGAPIVSRFDMTPVEHRTLMRMNESVSTLLEILEIRQAVDLQRTPGSTRVAQAIREGAFLDQGV